MEKTDKIIKDLKEINHTLRSIKKKILVLAIIFGGIFIIFLSVI